MCSVYHGWLWPVCSWLQQPYDEDVRRWKTDDGTRRSSTAVAAARLRVSEWKLAREEQRERERERGALWTCLSRIASAYLRWRQAVCLPVCVAGCTHCSLLALLFRFSRESTWNKPTCTTQHITASCSCQHRRSAQLGSRLRSDGVSCCQSVFWFSARFNFQSSR